MDEDMPQDTAEPAAAAPPASLIRRLLANPWLMLALAGLFWSGNHIAGRAAAGHVPPLGLGSLRWLLGAAIMWPFVAHHVRADWPKLRAGWRPVLALSLIGGAVFSSIQYLALQRTSALNASIFNSFAPAIIVAIGALAFRERLRALNLFGVAVSFCGVMIIVSRGDLETFRSFTFNFGDLLLLLNMIVWAIYSVFLRLRPSVHPLTFTFCLALIAGVTLAPFWAFEHAQGFAFQPTALTFAVIAYVTIFPGLLAYICWNRGVEAVGAARGGVFLHLIPVYGAILATLLLGEILTGFHIAGCALILAGVWFASRK
jgi:drug/metabolite transporter (DMT)-like permease